MLRRVVALALTLVLMSSPLALALCHVECASASRGQAAHHSCHGSSEPAAVAMTAVPHVCGHTDEAPAGLDRTQHTLAAPVAVVPLAAWTPPSIVERVVAVDIQHSPPGSFQLVSQLRV